MSGSKSPLLPVTHTHTRVQSKIQTAIMRQTADAGYEIQDADSLECLISLPLGGDLVHLNFY